MSRFTTVVVSLIATVGACATGPFVGQAFAQPKIVHAGSTGNARLDDVCRQMADVINDEVRNGNDAELNFDLGSANAWFAQAEDHIRRAQAMGCVISMKAPTAHRPGHPTKVMAHAATRKTITGTATAGKGHWSQDSCGQAATIANSDLDKSEAAGKAGNADEAQGWRQAANDVLKAGRDNGCEFSAALWHRVDKRFRGTGQVTGTPPNSSLR